MKDPIITVRSSFAITTATIVLAAAVNGSIAERVLGSRFAVYLGEISFGIYLLHRPIMYLWQDLVGLNLHWIATF